MPIDRAANYRVHALKALQRAERATTPEFRRTFLELARAWHTLAVDLERSATRPWRHAGDAALPGLYFGTSRAAV